MKTLEQIEQQIDDCRLQLQTAEDVHKGLSQIEMLSSTGNKLREQINELRGKIMALFWVREDKFKAL